ncbi:hypothetical protein Lrub_1462 [Legionella rubrilucens]|uniref:Uncharacterized protein n=1 Tax=Legionella rubrilucens TaxID=458 RepID=A0A0W0XWH0_9GAMM|nr:hypothetical protein [Legionella rubrilucens]KTD49111.1 hypothetical protein Lrub_1462 [Legionella rubrilucens]
MFFDLKTAGTKHLHYPWGYKFTNPSHDILNVGDTPAMNLNGDWGSYVKGNRYDLDTAVNHSVNPAITPDGDILPLSYWWKIEFNNNDYLCINTPLSPSGHGANIMQHYIVENVSNAATPIIYFYFFDKEVMPITTTN